MATESAPTAIDDLNISAKDAFELLETLGDSLTEKGIEQWLAAPSRLLHGAAPITCLRRGEVDEVLSAARAFMEGVYV